MRRFLIQQWFLIGLLVLIPSGFAIGMRLSEEDIQRFNGVAGKAMSRGLTAAILFLMAVTLETRKLTAALRSPRPVVWASLVNAGIIPLMAWPMVGIQKIPDFEVGLMIAASVPCTMAAASVWTRAAGGNDAISLLVTTLTNGLCFLITPFWLGLASRSRLDLAAGAMVIPLMIGGFLPIAAGQAVRLWRDVARLADRHKLLLGSLAQVCLLVQVVWACLQAGPSLRSGLAAGDGWGAALLVWACCVALHTAGLLIAWMGAKVLGLRREDQIAVAFAGSQKTLPIGVLIAKDPNLLGGAGLPFAIFPMLMYHASQLIIDTLVATRVRQAAPRSVDPPVEASVAAS
jgi:sodium/bile acid cotransporter 7